MNDSSANKEADRQEFFFFQFDPKRLCKMTMKTALLTLVVSVTTFCTGCAGPTARPLSESARAAIKSANVVVLAPEEAHVPDRVNGAVSGSDVFAPGTPAPGLTQAQSFSGPGIVGGAIAMALLDVLIGGDVEKDRAESREIFLKNAAVFSSEQSTTYLLDSLNLLRSKTLEVPIDQVEVVLGERSSSGGAAPDKTKVTVWLRLSQRLSPDLSKLRLKLIATVKDPSGAELMNEVVNFLPTGVAGATKQAAMESWIADDARLYREQIKLGVDSMMDAVNVVFFSGRVHSSSVPSDDASRLLRQTNCYGGDYDVGIPMEAYKSGIILANRSKYSIVRLQDGQILTFPACGSV